MSRFVTFLLVNVMSAFAADVLGVPFRVTSEFLDLEDCSKGIMLQSNQKLAQKLAPIQITEAKKHNDVIIIKNRSSKKVNFYLKLEKRMIKPEEFNRSTPGYYNTVQEFFAERDLDEFYFLFDFPTDRGIIFAKHKIRNFIDLCFPLEEDPPAEFALDFFKNKLLAGDKIDWKDGEFSLEGGKLTHLNRSFGGTSILVRTAKEVGESLTLEDEFREVNERDWWGLFCKEKYPNYPCFEAMKMFIRNAEKNTINTAFVSDPDKFVQFHFTDSVSDFPDLLKLLLEHGLDPNVKLTVDVHESRSSVDNFAVTDGSNQSLIHIIANRAWAEDGRKHKMEMIKLLYEANADIKALAGNGENALFFMFKLDGIGTSTGLHSPLPENLFTSSNKYYTNEFEVFKSLIETYGIDPFENMRSEIWHIGRWRNEKIRNYLKTLMTSRIKKNLMTYLCFGMTSDDVGNMLTFARQNLHYILVIGLALLISLLYHSFRSDVSVR